MKVIIFNEIIIIIFVISSFRISSAQVSDKNNFNILKNFRQKELLQANQNSSDINTEIISGKELQPEKSAVLAGVLSAFFPGSGQIYNGDWLKAGIQWLLLTGSIYLMVYDVNFDSENSKLSSVNITGISIGAATWIWSIVDAVISANKLNIKRDKQLKQIRNKK